MPDTTAGVALITGPAIFLLGAAIGVPRVFTEPDREKRRQMLEARLVWWRVSQPLYAVGALITSLGVGALAAVSNSVTRTCLGASSGLLLLGALAWSWAVYLRGVHPHEFTLGELPGWPFATYVWSTLAGLLLLGGGLLLGAWPSWLGWLVLACDALFAVAYLRTRDIPPFVFYLLFLVVGITVA
ncbi:MAG TPA: hypothetical protein PLT68_12505 [Actinomycetota bacterium]|nr:hypothetical protein [Actinomycetota bacterium]